MILGEMTLGIMIIHYIRKRDTHQKLSTAYNITEQTTLSKKNAQDKNIQHSDTQNNSIQRKNTYYNHIQYNNAQHNNILHNDTYQHNET
jgi:hypothetical protein